MIDTQNSLRTEIAKIDILDGKLSLGIDLDLEFGTTNTTFLTLSPLRIQGGFYDVEGAISKPSGTTGQRAIDGFSIELQDNGEERLDDDTRRAIRQALYQEIGNAVGRYLDADPSSWRDKWASIAAHGMASILAGPDATTVEALARVAALAEHMKTEAVLTGTAYSLAFFDFDDKPVRFVGDAPLMGTILFDHPEKLIDALEKAGVPGPRDEIAENATAVGQIRMTMHGTSWFETITIADHRGILTPFKPSDAITAEALIGPAPSASKGGM